MKKTTALLGAFGLTGSLIFGLVGTGSAATDKLAAAEFGTHRGGR